jgi:hypothetical protein
LFWRENCNFMQFMNEICGRVHLLQWSFWRQLLPWLAAFSAFLVLFLAHMTAR